MEDRIERSVEIKAPVSRIWRALTDHEEFGEWFRVKLEGPFKVGEVSRGQILVPGFEHVAWEAVVASMEPEQYFAFAWHPYAIEPGVDYSDEPRTLVEFRLQPVGEKTRLIITESGFGNIPDRRRLDAFRANSEGWAAQAQNIAQYVER
jgi:uncharacterized protein YndB with AHSA1/START domain